MKRFLGAILAAAVLLSVSGCRSGDNENSGNIPPTDEQTSPTESADIPPNAEQTYPTESENSSETASDLPQQSPAINEELFAIGDALATSFSELFLDYLQFEESRQKLKTSYPYVEYECEGEVLTFAKISDDSIHTISDLYAVFGEVCTAEYCEKLLTKTSVIYKDIGGSLYRTDTMACFSQPSYDTYFTKAERSGDSIVFTLADVAGEYNSDGTFIRDEEWDKTYALTAVCENGKWLISDCEDAALLGYCYNGRTLPELIYPPEIQTTDDGFQYRAYDGYAEIYSYTGDSDNVTTPAEINGLPVTRIGISAFSYGKAKHITVSEGVSEIDAFAFSSPDIESVTLPTTLTGVGPCCFAESSVKSVVFPTDKTVALSFGAFTNCKKLESISAREFEVFSQSWVIGCDRLSEVSGITENTFVIGAAY